ncbi:hypothetical protein [Succinimonas sp.]|uniref:hypothetical protein n=1 Tax=Succinimonas sp. TaxID=1936151 RepID=UPI003862F1F7
MELHVDLRKTVLSVIGGVFCYFLMWKLLLIFVSVSETIPMIFANCIIGAFVLAAYSVQRVEWSVDSSWSVSEVIQRRETTVYSQYKLFGLFGISEPEIESRVLLGPYWFSKPEIELGEIIHMEFPPLIDVLSLTSSVKSLLPFGGYFHDL